MGWTGYPTPPHDPKAEVARILTGYGPDVPFETEIVQHSVVGSTHYVAIRWTPKPGQKLEDQHYEIDPETGSFTWAAVVLTQRYQGEWLYKDMEEGMGPNESKAPISLINKLSPTTKQYALDWRERCRAYASSRIQPKTGDTVKLHEPWEPYGDLFEKVEYHRRRGVYRSLKNQQLVRLRTSQIKEIVNG